MQSDQKEIERITKFLTTYYPDHHITNDIAAAIEAGNHLLDEPSAPITLDSEPDLQENEIKTFPNPFNASTSIIFHLKEPQHVQINVYDLLGRNIHELAAQNYDTGEHRIVWDGVNASGHSVPSGLYFITVVGEDIHRSQKVMMLK